MAKHKYKHLDIFQQSRQWENSYSALGKSILLADNLGYPVNHSDMAMNLTGDPCKITKCIIIAILEGEMVYDVNLGRNTARKGELVVIMPNTIGQLVSMSEDVQVAIIYFEPEFWPIHELSPECLTLFNRFFTSSITVNSSKSLFARFLDMYGQIKQLLGREDYEFKEIAVKGYLQIMLADACQWIVNYYRNPENMSGNSNNIQRIYNNFIELVKQNYRTERAIPFYADKLCLSTKYLGQVVVKASGKSALDLIADYVILEAKALLKSRCYNVQQISGILNFPNPSFFGKYFKAHTGMTPRHYMME